LVSLVLRFPKFLSIFLGIEIGVLFTDFFFFNNPFTSPLLPHPEFYFILFYVIFQGAGGVGMVASISLLEGKKKLNFVNVVRGFRVYGLSLGNDEHGGDHACVEGFWGVVLGNISLRNHVDFLRICVCMFGDHQLNNPQQRVGR